MTSLVRGQGAGLAGICELRLPPTWRNGATSPRDATLRIAVLLRGFAWHWCACLDICEGVWKPSGALRKGNAGKARGRLCGSSGLLLGALWAGQSFCGGSPRQPASKSTPSIHPFIKAPHLSRSPAPHRQHLNPPGPCSRSLQRPPHHRHRRRGREPRAS